jgi:hypothetical protein
MLPNNNNNQQCLPLLLHPQFLLPCHRGLLPLLIAPTKWLAQCRTLPNARRGMLVLAGEGRQLHWQMQWTTLQLGKSSPQLSFKPWWLI